MTSTSLADPTALPDQPVRQAAVDISQSFIISAPAGSGKTGLLTQRVLTLLAAVTKPEEILCITFTRKAANEMRERIFATLHAAQACRDGQTLAPTDDYQRHLMNLAAAALANSERQQWALLDNKYRLKITTIDGFCKGLCQSLPFLSEMGAGAGILEQPHSAYEQAVDHWLVAQLGQSDYRFQALLRLFEGDTQRLSDLFIQLLSVREQWLPLALQARQDPADARRYFEAVLAQLVAEHIDTLKQQLALYESELCDLAAYAANNLREMGSNAPAVHLHNVCEFAGSDDRSITHFWQPLADLLLTTSGSYRKSLTKNQGFPSDGNKEEKAVAKAQKAKCLALIAELAELPEIRENLLELNKLPRQKYDENQWQTLENLILVLPEISAHLTLVFGQLRKADFTEFALAALRALADVSSLSDTDAAVDLQQKLDYRLHHLLIDEFQDTSAPQLQLLQRLTREWQPDDGRTLFLVGDGMQSCYGFRNANVGIFLDVKHKGLPNVRPLAKDLSVNFRSCRAIVEWVNHTFSQVLPQHDAAAQGAVSYSQSHFIKENQIGSAVSCHYFEDDESDNHRQQPHLSAKAREAEFIAQQIIAAKHQDPTQSIAVLAKNRSHLHPIVAALHTKQVDFQAVDIDPLLSKFYVRDLLNLARAIVDPSDRLAWIALLRAPWCALNFADLYHLATAPVPQNPRSYELKTGNIVQQLAHMDAIDTLSDEGRQHLRDFWQVLSQALAIRQRKRLSYVVETCWRQLGGPACLPSAAAAEDIDTLLDYLQNYDSAGLIADWESFEKSLDSLYAKPQTHGENPVQLLTMHKSKGLEYDTVFITGLEKTGRNDEQALLYWLETIDQHSQPHFLISPISGLTTAALQTPNTGNQTHPEAVNHHRGDNISDYIRHFKKSRQQLENARLLYVACTRAKSRLYLTTCLKHTDKGEVKPPSKNALLHHLWPHLKDQFQLTQVAPTDASLAQHGRTANTPNLPSAKRPYILHLEKGFSFADFIDENPANNEVSHDNDLQSAVLNTFDNTDFNVVSAFHDLHLSERALGIAVHRIMQSLAESPKNGQALQQLDLDQQQLFWRSQLLQLGLTPNVIATYLPHIRSAVQQLLGDDTARWLLDNRHPHSACELMLWRQHIPPINNNLSNDLTKPVATNHRMAPTTQERIVDRTFIEKIPSDTTASPRHPTTSSPIAPPAQIVQLIADKQATRQLHHQQRRWIIDYKTATPAPKQTREDFFQQQRQQYRQQMHGYRHWLTEIDKANDRHCDVILMLYFPFLADFTVVD